MADMTCSSRAVSEEISESFLNLKSLRQKMKWKNMQTLPFSRLRTEIMSRSFAMTDTKKLSSMVFHSAKSSAMLSCHLILTDK